MFKLVANGTAGPNTVTPINITLRQENDDVNIYLNDSLIAYFEVSNGKVRLNSCVDDGDAEIIATEDGLIKVF